MAGPPYISVEDVDRAEYSARDILECTRQFLNCVHKSNSASDALDAIDRCGRLHVMWGNVLQGVGYVYNISGDTGLVQVASRLEGITEFYGRYRAPLCVQLACLAYDIHRLGLDVVMENIRVIGVTLKQFKPIWPKIRKAAKLKSMPKMDYDAISLAMQTEFANLRQKVAQGEFEPTRQSVINACKILKQEIANSTSTTTAWAHRDLVDIHSDIHRTGITTIPLEIPSKESLDDKSVALNAVNSLLDWCQQEWQSEKATSSIEWFSIRDCTLYLQTQTTRFLTTYPDVSRDAQVAYEAGDRLRLRRVLHEVKDILRLEEEDKELSTNPNRIRSAVRSKDPAKKWQEEQQDKAAELREIFYTLYKANDPTTAKPKNEKYTARSLDHCFAWAKEHRTSMLPNVVDEKSNKRRPVKNADELRALIEQRRSRENRLRTR